MAKTIKGFMREIEKVYKAKAEEVAETFSQVQKLKSTKEKAMVNRDLSSEGRSKLCAAIDEQIKECEQRIEALRREANDSARTIRDEMEKTFYSRYHATGEDIDQGLLALIQAGVMTDEELLRAAETANTTMRRFIGKALDDISEHKDRETAMRLHQKSLALRQSSDPHLEVVDALMNLGDYACGGARMSGASAASVYLRRWDEMTAPLYQAAPCVRYNGKDADGKSVFVDDSSEG